MPIREKAHRKLPTMLRQSMKMKVFCILVMFVITRPNINQIWNNIKNTSIAQRVYIVLTVITKHQRGELWPDTFKTCTPQKHLSVKNVVSAPEVILNWTIIEERLIHKRRKVLFRKRSNLAKIEFQTPARKYHTQSLLAKFVERDLNLKGHIRFTTVWHTWVTMWNSLSVNNVKRSFPD